MPEPLQTRILTIGTQKIRIAEGGARRARRSLLLFNGIGASVETVGAFTSGFERTRVITFDVPGVGASPAPRLPYRFSEVARLAAAILDRLGLEQVDVLGVSWGGAAAQEFAIRSPERCQTLTLAATSAGFVMVPGQPAVLHKLLSPRRYFDPTHLMTIGGELYGGALRTERELLRVHAEAMRSPSRVGYVYQLLAVCGWTSWHRLHRVTAPTLILMGADDPIVPPINGRILAARLRDATVESIDCGHLFLLTRPREIAQRIERFQIESAADPAETVRAKRATAATVAETGDLR